VSSTEVEADAVRRAIFAALIEVVGSVGFAQTTIEAVVVRAGVERAEFDRHFHDLEDCYFQAWDSVKDEYVIQAAAAFQGAETWRDAMRATAHAIIEFLDSDHNRARFFVTESLLAGERLQRRRDVTHEGFIELVHRGRFEMDDPDRVPRTTAEGLAGAVNQRVRKIVRDGAWDRIPEEKRSLMYLVVMPYLGRDVAVEELNWNYE
jgi:AcrR family transcriptional regulator